MFWVSNLGKHFIFRIESPTVELNCVKCLGRYPTSNQADTYSIFKWNNELVLANCAAALSWICPQSWGVLSTWCGAMRRTIMMSTFLTFLSTIILIFPIFWKVRRDFFFSRHLTFWGQHLGCRYGSGWLLPDLLGRLGILPRIQI